MRHGPQRTSPSSATGERSSQRRSYSRTACTPPPRSTRFEPTGDASSSASAGGSVSRSSSARRRFSSAAGWMRRSSGRISSRIRPRTVSRFDESSRNGEAVVARSSARVSSRQTQSSGRTTPSSRFALMPFGVAARHEPVEDRLDLVGRACGRWRGGGPSRSRSGSARSSSSVVPPRAVDDLGAERSRQKRASSSDSSPRRPWFTCSAETRVAELAEHVPEARRVGAAGDEDRDGARRER